MNPPEPPQGDAIQNRLRGFAARFQRTLAMCWEVTHRVWRDPALGPRYRAIVYWQGLGVGVVAAILFALGIGIHQASKNGLGHIAALLASIWAVLLTAHLVVIALSYRYHDHLTREASWVVGVYPEDEALEPRVKLDLRWISKRIKRRIRGFLVMVPGFVTFWFVSLVAGSWVSTLLGAAWVAHWWVAFSLAKTARAWHEPAIAEPWYARAWDAAGRFVPPLRWSAFAWWRDYLASSATSVWSPLTWLERRTAEGTALSLMRLLANVPGFGLALRPLIPICASLVIEHGDDALDFVQHGAVLQEPPREHRSVVARPVVPDAVVLARTVPPAPESAQPPPLRTSTPPASPRPRR